MTQPRVAVIGGGINGCGIAWELARRGYAVTLYERGEFGGATSSATTKMIHGGLRYLEHYELGLVRESLRERAFLLRSVPWLVRPLRLVIPFYRGSPRPRWMIHAGLFLYDLLAGSDNVGRHRTLSAAQVLASGPLQPRGIEGGFLYYDAQVDDRALVRTVAASAMRDGCDAREHTPVERVAARGAAWEVRTARAAEEHDAVVNAVGPWMEFFLARNHLETTRRLALIRGSHVVLAGAISEDGFLLQSPDDQRVLFVLPWKGDALVGTTEVVHRGPLDRLAPSDEEIDYLLARVRQNFTIEATRERIVDSFAGVRPLIGEAGTPSAITREYRIDADGTMVNVFGGKMTTFLSLARKAADEVDEALGERRVAIPPRFERLAV